MRLLLSIWLTLALGLGVVGLLAGGVGGLAGGLLRDTPEAIAQIAGWCYWLLLPALPLALWALADISLDAEENAPLYANQNRTFTAYLGAGLAGALAASAVYFIPATNLPVFLRKAEAIAMRVALYEHIGWTQVFIVAAATTLAAAAVAAWAVQRAKRDA